MRVLHLIPYMHPRAGGPPVVAEKWCALLNQAGDKAAVLTTDAYAEPSDGEGWIDEYQRQFPIQVLPGRGPKGFGYAKEMRRRLRRCLYEVDLVHVHNLWGYTNRIAAAECHRAGKPFVVSTHGMADPHSLSRKAWKKRLYGRFFEWPQLRRAAGVVFTHSEEGRLAEESCGALPPGHVVSLGTDSPPAKPRAELADAFYSRFGECRAGRLVVFLSRLHSKKGLDLLLPAMARLMQEDPDIRLALVGPGETGYVAELKSVAEREDIADRCTWTGPLSGDVKWGALAAADVYALPSYQENFAIALVEALRVGTPVVCSRRVNICSDLEQAGAAQICELTVESVAQSISRLLRDEQRAAAQGAAGAKLASGKYTWQASTDALRRVYQEVLNGYGGG